MSATNFIIRLVKGGLTMAKRSGIMLFAVLISLLCGCAENSTALKPFSRPTTQVTIVLDPAASPRAGFG